MKMKEQSPANPDLYLWQQVKEGNEMGLRKLIEKYFNTLQNYGFKFIRNEDFVKDCVQEVFIEIWTRRDRISVPQSARAYLLSSVRKRVMREGYRQRMDKHNDTFGLNNNPDFAELSAEWLAIEEENISQTSARISTILNELPKRQREAIYLRYYQNLNRDEIAEIMGVNAQSVSNFLQVGFKTFRENWAGIFLVISALQEINFN